MCQNFVGTKITRRGLIIRKPWNEYNNLNIIANKVRMKHNYSNEIKKKGVSIKFDKRISAYAGKDYNCKGINC